MQIPEEYDYSYLDDRQAKLLEVIIDAIEDGGYFLISKLQHFTDRDVAVIDIRGKDPLMSPLKRCNINTELLISIREIIMGKVSFNFEIDSYGYLAVPDTVKTESFDFTAPNDLLGLVNDTQYTPQTPVEVIWKLAKYGYSFIWNNCACVPCNAIYFGYDNFSIKVDYTDEDNNKKVASVIDLTDGVYHYDELYVVCNNSHVDDIEPTAILGDTKKKVLTDDLGRKREAYLLDLKRYEKNMFNMSKFNKIYDKDYTLTVLDIMYSIASYLNGMNMILNDMGVQCQLFSLPYRGSNTFSIDSNKQHNNFTFQNIWYSLDIVKEVKKVYLNHKEDLIEYLKYKNEDKRQELYDTFIRECDGNFGTLLHYFVNGFLDALAIQKGDKKSRVQILSDYIGTVHREFIMYGCYFYDLRTVFLRNNFRIRKEFESTILLNKYNGCYFRVG